MILVVGAGYVGLCNAVYMASHGNNVVVYDTNQVLIDSLSKGNVSIGSSNFKILINDLLLRKNLSFTTNPIGKFSNIYIAVPTNGNEDGTLDMSIVQGCIEKHQDQVNDGGFLTILSTINPFWEPSNIRHDIGIMYKPEFLREDSCWEDCKNQRNIYGNLGENSWHEAALIKVGTNTFLSTRLALANEIDRICKEKKISTKKVLDGISNDIRIGSHYLEPRGSYGGKCLPKDTRAFAKAGSIIAKAVDESNHD
jgi:UDPglucose 6-dehydrogenase